MDQSFEEHRSAAYEAKTTGTLPTLAAQIAQNAADAKIRMQQLYELNGDSLNVLVALYNNHPDSAGVVNNNNNPFSKVNKPLIGGNPFGAKPALLQNPFSNGGVPQPTQTTNSNIFGASSAVQQTNPFANSNSGLFGAPATSQSTTNNIFGNSATATSVPTTSSLFGGPTQSSFFGQAAAPAPATTTSNIFGNAPTSVFGAAPTFGSSVASSIFGGGAASGGQPQQQNIFGQPASTSSVFGGNTTALASAAPFGVAPSSLFGSAAAPAPMSFAEQPTNVFGAPAQHQQASVAANSMFAGGNNAFGAGANAFGVVAQQPANVFGLPPAVSNSNSVFGVTNANSTSVFGATTTTTTVANPFLNNQSTIVPDGFGQQPQQLPPKSSNNPSLYTKLEDLNEQECKAFSMPCFELGLVPVRPPPQQLIGA